MDVYVGELAGRPPRPNLSALPQIPLTPHISASGDMRMAKPPRRLFADNLRRYLDGQLLLNVVDRACGYQRNIPWPLRRCGRLSPWAPRDQGQGAQSF